MREECRTRKVSAFQNGWGRTTLRRDRKRSSQIPKERKFSFLDSHGHELPVVDCYPAPSPDSVYVLWCSNLPRFFVQAYGLPEDIVPKQCSLLQCHDGAAWHDCPWKMQILQHLCAYRSQKSEHSLHKPARSGPSYNAAALSYHRL